MQRFHNQGTKPFSKPSVSWVTGGHRGIVWHFLEYGVYIYEQDLPRTAPLELDALASERL
jgi:hypothetical protein